MKPDEKEFKLHLIINPSSHIRKSIILINKYRMHKEINGYQSDFTGCDEYLSTYLGI